jgi:hypothetical protein
MLTACEAETDWPLQTGNHNLLVVDGTITDEKKIQIIRLSTPVDQLNAVAPPVSDASIIVTLEDSVYKFHELAGTPGTYVSNNLFAGKKNKIHSLLISVGGKVYSAKASMEPGVVLVPNLSYTLDSVTKLYQISKVYNNEFNPVKPAMFEIMLDWSQVPGYQDADPESCKARLLYYVLPTLDVSQVFAPDAEQVGFPGRTFIVEKRYSLTTEHAGFLRELLSETTWQGGLFNSAAANIPTNLSQGAIGYFGACAVNTRSEIARP